MNAKITVIVTILIAGLTLLALASNSARKSPSAPSSPPGPAHSVSTDSASQAAPGQQKPSPAESAAAPATLNVGGEVSKPTILRPPDRRRQKSPLEDSISEGAVLARRMMEMSATQHLEYFEAEFGKRGIQ